MHLQSSTGPEPGKVSSQEHNHNTKQHFSSKFQRMSLGPRLTVSGLVWAASPSKTACQVKLVRGLPWGGLHTTPRLCPCGWPTHSTSTATFPASPSLAHPAHGLTSPGRIAMWAYLSKRPDSWPS